MPFLIPKRRAEPNSLFGEILDWMLAPLLLLWPITIFFTYQIATEIAHRPYDQALAERARLLMRFVAIDEGRPHFTLPAPAQWMLHAGSDATLYFEVRTPEERLAGNAQLPTPTWFADVDVRFHDIDYRGEPLRLATLIELKPHAHGQTLVAVQVAETVKQRHALVTEVLTGVMMPQFILVPIAVVLVWFGLTKGLAPLRRLQEHLARRRPTDLSPIDPERVPEEIRPLIEAFNRLMARLEENLAAQRRFIADAAHQMRTPITGLKMQAELAREATTPEELRADLERIIMAAERSARLINQLLTLARTESSSEQVHRFHPTDLVPILREAVADLYPKASRKGVALALEAPEECPPVIANPLMLGELFKNLIDNAITYTPPGGEVTLHLLQSDQTLSVAVDDTGPGIPPAERERIFEPFVRLPDTERLGEGSGLGLAIVREIAEQHQAEVLVTDPPHGRGCRFLVRFRCASLK
ncbi:sensor histidine kinase [Hydrogenophilus islandicus]